MTKYQAPTDFRAVRAANGFSLRVDGFNFGSLVQVVPGIYEFVTPNEELLEEVLINNATRPYVDLNNAADFRRFLAEVKKAYLNYAHQAFEEVQADQAAEASVAAHYEEGPAALRGYGADY